MRTDKPIYRHYPKVPIERRLGAFLIDFILVWLLSSFFGAVVQWLVFVIAWFVLRIIVVERNQGQSLGSWALDMKVINPRFNKIPGLVSLTKREGIVGLAALVAMIGLNIGLNNALSMLLLVAPLLADCGVAIADEEYNQAFHDRIAETMMIQTQRGFSLDLRLKKIVADLQRTMRK